MTTALYDLRAVQLGLSCDDLQSMTMGHFCDMATESANDSYKYPVKATRADWFALAGMTERKEA